MTDPGSTSSLAMKVVDSSSSLPGTADALSPTTMAVATRTLLSLGMPKTSLEPREFDDELLTKVHQESF